MIEKINFGAPNSSLLDGYILDSGAAYSLERGYGWITEASVGEENPTPIDIIPNSRDRNVHSDGLLDTLVAFQYRQDVFNPRAVKTNAAWEYNLPNGNYRVTVSVGDPIYDDSRHVINVEGETVISDFIPTADNLYQEVTQFVTVEDGKLTVDGIGGVNTKLNYIEISSVENAKINFGTNDADLPADYIQDSGKGFSSQTGYGWVRQDSLGNDEATPIDISPNARDRNTGTDVLTDSLVAFQYRRDVFNTIAVRTPAAWEYALADGEYRVTVSVGDASYTDSNHVINIEGEQVISGFIPTADELFKVATAVVTVDDGRLTIDGIGGENSKINYVEIEPASETGETSTDETPTEGDNLNININFGTPGGDTPEGYIQDFGAGYNQTIGYGWVTQDSLGDDPTPIDIIANTRDRFSVVSDRLQDSLIAFQYPEAIFNPDAVKIPAAWEYALANGTYEVTVSVGDASYTDSNHVINIEGQQVISGFIPTVNELFTTGTATVEVTDGKLTIDAIGGENTKLNYVQISSVGESEVSEEVSEF